MGWWAGATHAGACRANIAQPACPPPHGPLAHSPCCAAALPAPRRKLASEGAAKVFATDTILTTIMCMKSSKYSWDLIVSKHNGKIFIDRYVWGGAVCARRRRRDAPAVRGRACWAED